VLEYLLIPAAGVALVGLLAAQFLLQGVAYGPRARRVVLLLGLPAATVGVLVGAATPVRPAWLRVALGVLAALACYLAVATAVVWRWRNRKLAALVGDVAGLRLRLAQRRRDVDRLFWEMSAATDRRPPPPGRAEPVSMGEDGAVVLHAWQSAEPAKVAARAALIAQWHGEFARCGRGELLGRARVLEAASRDVPEDQRDALEARLATLWLVYRDLPEEVKRAPTDLEGPSPRARWDAAREELVRLQADLARILSQRSVLLQRRLPLD